MTAIGPGDYVEYLGSPRPGAELLVVGAIYRVTQVGVAPPDLACNSCGPGPHDWLLVAEVPAPPEILGWCVRHFRPVYRPKAGLIEGLLRGAFLDAKPERIA